MRSIPILLLFNLILPVSSLAQPTTDNFAFRPFEVTCALKHSSVSGAEDSKQGEPDLVVSLAGRIAVPEGRKLLRKVGDFEFYVSTKGVLIGEKQRVLELADYTAEIYNAKTNVRALSDSSDEVEPDKKSGANTIKIATVRLQSNGAELGMFCFHKPSADKSKRLKLRH